MIFRGDVWIKRLLQGALGISISYHMGYVLTTHASWLQFFLALDPCVYGADRYGIDFLTPEVKAVGNTWAFIAMGISLVMLWKVSHIPPSRFRLRLPQISWSQVWIHLPISITCLGLAIWLISSLAPAADEVFSAVHVASHPPFQAWAYYMYPNNHVLFNLLNSLFFFWAPDQVLAGKILSVFAYICLGNLLFGIWLKLTDGQYLLSFFATLPSLLQLPVWGFASQGRGYALYLFLMLGMVVLYIRWIATEQRLLSPAMPWIVAAGYATLPTFLFMHLALCGAEAIGCASYVAV
ncbi:MAG: hypothetical protein AAFR59_12550 [Bacteroidota bacterium]